MAPGPVVAAGKAPLRAGSDPSVLLLVPVLAGRAGDRLGRLAKLDASPAGVACLVSRPGSGSVSDRCAGWVQCHGRALPALALGGSDRGLAAPAGRSHAAVRARHSGVPG